MTPLKKTIYILTYLIILVNNINTASKLLKALQDESHERVTTLNNLKYEIENILIDIIYSIYYNFFIVKCKILNLK